MNELKEALLKVFPNHSENIRKFAKSKFRNGMKVYRIGFDCINGKCSVDDGVLYFGYIQQGFFTGVKVRSVRCKMFNIHCYAFFGGDSIHTVGYKDVTDWFIERYLEVGMCVDGDSNHYLVGDEKLSSCKYCGKKYTRKHKMIKKEWWEESR